MAIERSVRINIEAGRAKAELRSLQGSLRDTDRSANALAGTARVLTGAIAAIASVQSARALLNTADSYTALQNKIKAVSDESTNYAEVSERIFQISQRSRSSIEATTDLYSKLIRVNKTLNASQDELFQVLETVSKAVSLSGASAQAAEGAIIQFAQALSGNFSAAGQEINSILEQTPGLAEAIASGLGVSSDQIKRLATDGLLTTKNVFDALKKSTGEVDEAFARTAVTVDSSFTILGNAITKYIGQADQANGVTASIAENVVSLASNFEEIADSVIGVAVPAVTLLAGVIAGRLTASVVAYTSDVITSTAAQLTATKSTTGLAAALGVQSAGYTRATVAANAYTIASRGAATALGVFGGPVGVAVLAATALGAYAVSMDEAKVKSQDAIGPIDQLALSLRELYRVISGGADEKLINDLAGGFAKNTADVIEKRIESTKNKLEEFRQSEAKKGLFDKSYTQDVERLKIELKALEVALERINTKQKETAGSGGDTVNNVELQTQAYLKLKGSLDEVQAIQNRYNETVKKIKDTIKDEAKQNELIALATKKRNDELERLATRQKKQQDQLDKLHRSYADILGDYDALARVGYEYEQALEDINNSTATAEQKQKLLSELYRKTAEDIDGAVTTTREYIAQFDAATAAEIRREEALRALEKTVGSKTEKDRAALLIEQQYRDSLQETAERYIQLKAQFDPISAAQNEYLQILKAVDKAGLDDAQTKEIQTLALKAYADALEDATKQARLNEATTQSFFGALAQGAVDTAYTAENSFDQIRQVGRDAINGLADQITQFVATGEADFRAFAANVVAELLKIQTQILINNAIAGASGGGGISRFFKGLVGATGNAHGGAFAEGERKFARGGVPDLTSMVNSIVKSPTKFASGDTLNEAGEAGAEAILPLQRTAGGELGVRADMTGGMAAPAPEVTVPVQVINVTERPSDYLSSAAGTKQIVNIMRENREVFA